MHCLVFEKKSQTEDQIYFAGDLPCNTFLNKQASLLTATSHTVEVSGLKQSLERAEEEHGQVKKQLEDNQGMQNLVCIQYE